MAKFCVYCGTSLEEGAQCTCEGKSRENDLTTPKAQEQLLYQEKEFTNNSNHTDAASAAASAATSAAKNALLKALSDFTEFGKSPIKASQAILNEATYSRSITLILFQALITGLLFYLPIKDSIKILPLILPREMQNLSKMLLDLDISFLFFYPFFIVIALAFALAFFLSVFSKPFNIELPFQKSLSMTAAASIPLTMAWGINFLLIYIFGVGLWSSSFFVAVIIMLSNSSVIASYCIICSLMQIHAPNNLSHGFYVVTFSNMALVFGSVVITWALVAQKVAEFPKILRGFL